MLHSVDILVNMYLIIGILTASFQTCIVMSKDHDLEFNASRIIKIIVIFAVWPLFVTLVILDKTINLFKSI